MTADFGYMYRGILERIDEDGDFTEADKADTDFADVILSDPELAAHFRKGYKSPEECHDCGSQDQIARARVGYVELDLDQKLPHEDTANSAVEPTEFIKGVRAAYRYLRGDASGYWVKVKRK